MIDFLRPDYTERHFLLFGVVCLFLFSSYRSFAQTKTLPHYQSQTIPGRLTCLLKLKKSKIKFRTLDSIGLIHTPIEILSTIDGLEIKTMSKRQRLIVDCRFAIALKRAVPFFKANHISRIHFSNSYRKHSHKKKRVSRHSLGLAIDIHYVDTIDGRRLYVKKDFEKGLSDPCDEKNGPILNRVACVLRSHGVFDYVLTPDTDSAHYNHFHLSIVDHQRRRRPEKTRRDPIDRN